LTELANLSLGSVNLSFKFLFELFEDSNSLGLSNSFDGQLVVEVFFDVVEDSEDGFNER